MKRFLAALLAALTVFTLTGCGKTENPAEPVTPGQGEEPATPTEPELTPEEIAEQERLAAEKAREERLQGLLDSMTLEEKVGQLFFVRCPETNAVEDISTYHLGGYLLFGRDYKDGDSWLTWEQSLPPKSITIMSQGSFRASIRSSKRLPLRTVAPKCASL